MNTDNIPIQKLKELLQEFATNAREYHVTDPVQVKNQPPTAVEFLRDFVATNTPLVIRNGAAHWPAMEKWDVQYLLDKCGDTDVHVAFSPKGYADAETDGKFILPDERVMKFKDAMTIFQQLADSNSDNNPPPPSGIPYCQFQNSSLHKDFPSLLQDVGTYEWAQEAFGDEPPEAVNVWVGPDEALSSMHSDPYENLYAVIRGSKTFTLMPPTDLATAVNYTYNLPVYQYKFDPDTSTWSTIDLNQSVRWISKRDDYTHRIRGRSTQDITQKPLQVTLFPGDVLFLPSHWYHSVQQRRNDDQVTVAVNKWWNCKFDARFATLQLLENIDQLLASSKT